MKALIYHKKHSLENFAIQLAEVPMPEIRKTDLLIKVMASAVNPGDTQFRAAVDAPDGGYVNLGFEFSGIVEKVGPEAIGFKEGDRVFGGGDPTRHGSDAEYVAVDYRTVAVFPDSISFSKVAGLALTGLTVWQSLFRKTGDLPADVKTVLITGAAGGVGSIAIQILKARTNATVIATASRPGSAEWCRKMGADHVIDHHGNVPEQLRELGFYTVDLIYSVNGIEENMGWYTQVIRPYGYLAIIDLKDAVDFSGLMLKSPNIILETVFTRIIFDDYPEKQGAVLKSIAQLIEAGKIQSTVRTIFSGLTAENLLKAHTMLETGSMIGKVVISLDPDEQKN
jgi:NADPH2:quinone reductase